jgi:hypothetical protein
MKTETIETGEAGGQVGTATRRGENRRKGRFWVPLVWAAVPTVLVTLCTGFWQHLEFPEQVVGVLLFAVVLPAAVICEKLGFGEFSILGVSTVPDWLFFSVMIVLVYLYSLVLVVAGRGVVRFVGVLRANVEGERGRSLG